VLFRKDESMKMAGSKKNLEKLQDGFKMDIS
jgi:hypothetical protein